VLDPTLNQNVGPSPTNYLKGLECYRMFRDREGERYATRHTIATAILCVYHPLKQSCFACLFSIFMSYSSSGTD